MTQPTQTHAVTITIAWLAAWLAACETAPSSPNWSTDVRPLIAANCARCHTTPAIGGAPNTFRLDVYENTTAADGRPLLGAGAMAEFMAARASRQQMPPRFPLPDHQAEVFENWFALAEPSQAPPRGEPRPSNRPPSISLLAPARATGDEIVLNYEIRDPDFDIVNGTLRAQADDTTIVIARTLHYGRGTAVWDVGTAPPGGYRLIADITDGDVSRTFNVGDIEVSHANTAPRVTLGALATFTVANINDNFLTIEIDVTDPDLTDAIELTIELLSDTETITGFAGSAMLGANSIPVDLTGLTAGGWRVVATASDGESSRSVTSAKLLLSDRPVTTRPTFDDVEDIFRLHCTVCHPGGGRIPGLSHDFASFDNPQPFVFGVSTLRNEIYRRVVLERNMPPRSRTTVNPQIPEMTPDEREAIAAWIETGAAP